jgi:DNA-binding transcriptional LysR family regulator
MLDLHRLRLLTELSQRGTIAAVAEALSYAPSSVSAQLSKLEQEAKTPLLEQAGRGLRLTPAAEALVRHAETLLHEMELAETELAQASGTVTGTIRLAMFQSAALALLPGTLRRLGEDHPGLRVEMTQTEPATALRETWQRDYDLVVAEQYPQHSAEHLPGLIRSPLTRDRLRLATWHGSGVTSLAEAAELPWVVEPAPAASRHWTLQQCRLAGFEPDLRYESADLQAHVQLVESQLAVTILPSVLGGYRRPRVKWIGLPRNPHREIFTALRGSMSGHPGVLALRAALEAEAGTY